MHPDSAKQYVELMLDFQFDLLYGKECWGVNHAEFLFVRAASVISEHAPLREWILSKIEQSLLVDQYSTEEQRPPGFVPWDFVCFLAHQTRWSEFIEMAQVIKESPADVWPGNPLVRTSTELQNALSDQWEDQEFYETFTKTSV